MNTLSTSTGCSHEHGFTLIEILIAVVIFSIGLLGLAGMQIRGSEGTSMAYFRSQATLIANDMAERLHANRSGAYDDNAYAAMDSSGVCGQAAPNPFCATRGNTPGASCSPAQMAAFDLYTLACSADELLPSASITVTCNDHDAGDGDACTAGSAHTVTVSWNEVSGGKSQPSDVTLVVLP